MIHLGLKVNNLFLPMEVLKKIGDKKRADAFLEALTQEIAVVARRLAPRDTGKLEGAIIVKKVDDETYAILVNVPYAKFMEYGSRYIKIGTIKNPKAVISASGKQSYRPFIRPAIWQIVGDAEKLIKEVYDLK